MRKAQMEIMGLVIIVVLVTMGLFLSLAFRKPPAQDTLTDIYGNEKLASDFLITFLETHESTCGQKMQDIIIDCIREQTGAGRYACQGTNSCDFISKILVNITDQTLKEWGLRYSLTLIYKTVDPPVELVNINNVCLSNQDRFAPGIQPIPLYGAAPGTAALTLDICK